VEEEIRREEKERERRGEVEGEGQRFRKEGEGGRKRERSDFSMFKPPSETLATPMRGELRGGDLGNYIVGSPVLKSLLCP
jgi:hypothetical protein